MKFGASTNHLVYSLEISESLEEDQSIIEEDD